MQPDLLIIVLIAIHEGQRTFCLSFYVLLHVSHVANILDKGNLYPYASTCRVAYQRVLIHAPMPSLDVQSQQQ